MAIHTDWVSPAQEITGRDHLGVQAVSEHLYATLLPGITNVTDRARCYAFYPWFVWKFDREAKNKGVDEFIRMFRRAECLHSLIGINHELETDNEWAHGGGLVGRERLVAAGHRISEGKTIRLSQFSELDATTENRYFKNKLGGLGQYYLGPLKELLILDGDTRQGVKYTDQWGATLAELFDSEVSGSEFFKAVREDQITLPVVRSLKSFCPCNLRRNKKERDAIIDLLFCRGQSELNREIELERRNTLLLVLDYARRVRNVKGQPVEPDGFLSSTYSRCLQDGTPWVVRPILEKAIKGWGIYQRHELLAVAVQGLFWAGLAALADDGGYARDVRSYAKWFGGRFKSDLGDRFTKNSFTSIVERRRTDQPSQENWMSKDHELSIADTLLGAQREDDFGHVVALSVQLMASLLARESSGVAYGRFQIADRFLDAYDISLTSLQRLGNGDWTEMKGLEWVEWLAANWGIQSHFRVALRKLRHQTQDTFRIVPLDDGLHVREAPTARWSSPRLTQAFRFLYDLGALDDCKDVQAGSYILSDFGEWLLENELGPA
jgi:hypothetical protein